MHIFNFGYVGGHFLKVTALSLLWTLCQKVFCQIYERWFSNNKIAHKAHLCIVWEACLKSPFCNDLWSDTLPLRREDLYPFSQASSSISISILVMEKV